MTTDESNLTSSQDYQTVARLIELHQQAAPQVRNLQALGAHIGLSEIQVQRLFSRWAGISPKRFAQYLTVQDIRARMENHSSLLDLSLSADLSSSSLVHDHFIRFYAMSPKQLREQGLGISIKHGFHRSPFGTCHIGTTDKGICWLSFIDPITPEESLRQLKKEWPNAELIRDDDWHGELVTALFDAASDKKPLYLHVKGSNFQLRVWEALLRIPLGQCLSYQAFATRLNTRQAARSVGSAIGRNPVSWLIPCHRVIRKSGVIGVYRWGTTRKQGILAWEQSLLRN